MLDKKTIRRGLLAARRALPPVEATANSAAICARVETLPEFEAARAILTYVASKDNEVDTKPLVERLLGGPRPVLVPATLGKGQMVWSRLESMDELETSAFGVMVPRPEYRRDTPPPAKSDMLMPGLGFEAGWRIGYGGGTLTGFLRDSGTRSPWRMRCAGAGPVRP